MDRLILGEEDEVEAVAEGEEKAESDLSLCLVGRFLTDESIRVQTMKDRMVDVWRPGKGLVIKEVELGLFIFQFFHP